MKKLLIKIFKRIKRMHCLRHIFPRKYALQDPYLKTKIEEIIEEYKITTIVETGIFEGKSTIVFSKLVDKVIGVELSDKFIKEVSNKLKKLNLNNVELIRGNSPEVLKEIMPRIDVDKTLFFLDAHWNSYWPILDEILSIEKNKGIILIHDFKVPNCPHLGFDTYKSQELDFEYVKNSLEQWSSSYKIEYNSEAMFEMRGVAFIYSK